MASATKSIKDVAVFINAASFVGLAKEVDLPTVESTTAPHETLAMQGTINIGVGLEPMEIRVAWEGADKRIARVAYNTRDAQSLMFRSVIEDHTGPRVTRENLVAYATGVFRSKQGGNFSPKSLATSESMMDVTYYREEIDGEVMVEIDLANNIYKVGGVDLNAERNRMLGLV